MRAKQRNRLILVAIIIVGVGIATGLSLMALNKNINLFYSPSQVANHEAPTGHVFRVGGLVEKGSVQRDPKSLNVRFSVTDGAHHVTVVYKGILPDLFREGQGIVAQGQLRPDGEFLADQVLAKHDENYMPPEVKDALATAKKLGVVPPNPHKN
mgnify:CR=1 FL=1